MKESSELLRFEGQGNKTVYNPSVPFEYQGREVIAARVEPYDSETDSRVMFFERKNGYYTLMRNVPSFKMQDPAVFIIEGLYVLRGVHVFNEGSKLNWQTDFYAGDSLSRLEYLSSGPIGMKDITLVDLNGAIGIFTRPRGKELKERRIGYFEVESLDDIQRIGEADYVKAYLINGIFDDNQWGGANQAMNLGNGRIGVIGHLAWFDKHNRKHYVAMSFIFNRQTRRLSDFKVLARREDFPKAPSKSKPILDDIVFPAGIDDVRGERPFLYAGLSDFCCGRIRINNPFNGDGR
ncbi:DUF1861 family protein [Candidatus Woesearchaeota archaeon]|nr:MAG: DUF1861 family protein [Candidatus Woesearchaeota archaeon]